MYYYKQLAEIYSNLFRYRSEENRHKRLLGSPGPGSSSQEAASQGESSVRN